MQSAERLLIFTAAALDEYLSGSILIGLGLFAAQSERPD